MYTNVSAFKTVENVKSGAEKRIRDSRCAFVRAISDGSASNFNRIKTRQFCAGAASFLKISSEREIHYLARSDSFEGSRALFIRKNKIAFENAQCGVGINSRAHDTFN